MLKIIDRWLIRVVVGLSIILAVYLAYGETKYPVWYPDPPQKLYFPLEDKDCEIVNGRVTLTSWFYYPRKDLNGALYRAINIPCSEGSLVYACSSGEVIETNIDRIWGASIKIKAGSGLVFKYYHLQNKNMMVKVGDKISRGQMFARVGRTGRETGVNLGVQAFWQGRPVCISSPYDNYFDRRWRCVGNGDIEGVKEL